MSLSLCHNFGLLCVTRVLFCFFNILHCFSLAAGPVRACSGDTAPESAGQSSTPVNKRHIACCIRAARVHTLLYLVHRHRVHFAHFRRAARHALGKLVLRHRRRQSVSNARAPTHQCSVLEHVVRHQRALLRLGFAQRAHLVEQLCAV